MLLPISLLLLPFTQAANVDDWRTRSIYQLITDRFAPTTPNAPCNTADRIYCGGTWQTIVSKLDYIQGMGFDSVWISPVGLSLEATTVYGQGYHGYWPTDPTKLNPHFGTADDLKALSSALHSRGMYLMVDLVLNDLVSQSNTMTDAQLRSDANGTLLFKKPSDYHPRCDVQWGNRNSEEYCWLSTSEVPLMDLATETEAVAKVFIDWVPGFVKEYSIDGFRLDATKHMDKSFQNRFCAAAGVFCIGEVFGDDAPYAGSFQGQGGIDSVFGFGMMYGFTAAFSGPAPSMASLSYYINQAASSYTDPSVVGTLLDNHDLPRFNSLTSDKSLVFNAIVGNWMYGGIPTAYYGLEQDISDGAADPANREALWLYNAFSTTASPTYNRIATLNKIRSYLNRADQSYAKTVASVAAAQANDIALARPGVLTVLTNRGASGTGTWQLKNTAFAAGSMVVDLLSCSNTTIGSDQSLQVTWTAGEPRIFVSAASAASGGFCGFASPTTTSARSMSVTLASADGSQALSRTQISGGPQTSGNSTFSDVSAPPTVVSSVEPFSPPGAKPTFRGVLIQDPAQAKPISGSRLSSTDWSSQETSVSAPSLTTSLAVSTNSSVEVLSPVEDPQPNTLSLPAGQIPITSTRTSSSGLSTTSSSASRRRIRLPFGIRAS